MRRDEAIKMIDDHKNKLVHPVEMLHWTWLRVIINNLSESEWETAVEKAQEIMSK
jgi:hypothetical protein